MYKKIMKRFFDFIFSLSILIITIPILIVISIIIKMDSPGRIFFFHERNGKFGEKFKVIKFRTMVQNASEKGPSHTLQNDQRVTKVGKFLRRISVDELPQLINVLKGEMSFIGPRPFAYRSSLTEKEKRKLLVAPGITGWAQVNGRSNLTKEQKIQYDLFYIDNINLKLDIQIIYKTIQVVFSGVGVNSNKISDK